MTDYKIPVYEGVGDNPIPPTPVSYGNADYFIGKYNDFVDYVVTERGNKMTTILTSSLVLYVDSFEGNDENGEGSISSPYKSIKAIIKYLDDREIGLGIGAELRIVLKGFFSEIDLYYLPIVSNTKRAKIVLDGDYILELADKDWKLNPFGFYELKNGMVIVSGINSITDAKIKWGDGLSIQFNTNNTKLYIDKCDFEIDGSKITNNFINHPIEITNTLFTPKNISIDTTERNGFVFSMGVGVMGFLNNTNVTYENVEKLNLAKCTYGCRLYIDTIEDLTSLKINYGGMAYQDIYYSNIQDRAKYIVNLLNSLEENDKLPLSAIRQYENIILPTPEGIKTLLESLEGDNRLDASKIKNLSNFNSFSTLTEPFIQPQENDRVTIKIGDTRWLQSGQYIKISNAGIYLVQNVVDSVYLVIKNIGDISNVNAGTQITAPQTITLTGKPGFKGFTTTSTALQQPAVGETLLVTLSNSDSIVTNSIIHIEGMDYFRVTNIVRATQQINCKRLGYLTDVAEGTNIPSGARVVVAGVQGIPGNGAYCYITDNFIVPNARENVTLKVTNSDFIVEGNWVFIYEVGYYEVVEVVDDNTIIVKNTGVSDNLVPTAEVFAPRKLINSSKHGESAFSFTRSSFLVPAIGESNHVFVDQVSWMIEGFQVFFNNSYYEIQSIDPVSKTVQLKNLSDPSVGSSLSENSLIILSGKKGEKGDKGDTGHFYTFVTQQFVTPPIGEFVEVSLQSTDLFSEGMYVYVQGVQGAFSVSSIINSNTCLLYNFNALDNVTVPINSKLFIYGTPNLEVLDTLSFTQPPIGGSVLVETLQPTTFFAEKSYCYIYGAGYYFVDSKGDYSLMLRNEYHGDNSNPGTIIPPSKIKSILGFPEHKVFRLSSPFYQPNPNNTVVASFDNFRFLNVGDILRSPNNGYYFVENISSSSQEVFLKNLAYGFSDEKPTGDLIPQGSLFYLSPPRGETGFNSNFTFTINNFLQPPVGQTANVFVQDVQFFITGQYITIENGGACYVITDIPSSNEITVKNLGWGNAPFLSNIPSGSKISSSGYVEDVTSHIHRIQSRLASFQPYNLLSPNY